MSIASPTLRSSSSTVPGPSLRRLPMSMRARPSTADTCTGTSNTASRSEAMRVVGPSGSAASGGASTADPSSSRLGSGILPSSLIFRPPELIRARHQQFVCAGAAAADAGRVGSVAAHLECVGVAAARADIVRNRLVDRRLGGGAVAVDAAIGPFETAIAERDIGLGEHNEPAFEAPRPHNIVELFLGGGVERIVDPHDDMRRGDELAEALAR